MPKVSVVIATFNRAHYIREAIDSVLAQTFTDYEIIVVDDGSTDETRKVVQSYGNKVRYFYRDHTNQSGATNFGVSVARGEYVAFLDDDDLWLPKKLEVQMEVLENNLEIGWVCNEAYYLDETDGTVLHWKKKPGNRETFASLYEENFIHHPSVVLRKKFLDEVGGFDPELNTTQDYDLWLRLAKVCQLRYIDVPLTKIRFHAKNKHKNKVQKLKDRVRVVSKVENTAHLNFFKKRTRLAREYYTHAEYFQRMALWKLACRTYLKSTKLDPLIGRHYWPAGKNKFISSVPYRIFRTYLRALYCLYKAADVKRKSGDLPSTKNERSEIGPQP